MRGRLPTDGTVMLSVSFVENPGFLSLETVFRQALLEAMGSEEGKGGKRWVVPDGRILETWEVNGTEWGPVDV